ncbi:hypothetical protein [Arthrobacter koreensis]|uniref:hypothetical protein n=1 Tax=Arthrobacter koreensis TaxID=199136 RepID=UPI003813E707
MKTVIPLHLRDRETVSPVEDQDTRFALVITSDGTLVNNTTHDTRRARRDACVDVLQTMFGGVADIKVRDILRLFGGADPDVAIGQISALYEEEGIDIYLEDVPVPEDRVPGLPVALWSIFQGYDNAAQNTILHFPSREERMDHLYRTLNSLSAAVLVSEGLTDHELAARLEARFNALIDQAVTVRLATSFVPTWAS